MANGEIVKIPQTSEKEQIRDIIIDLAKKHTNFNRAFTLPSHSPIFEKELIKQGMDDIYCVENDIDTFIECKKNILPQMNLYHKNAIDLIRELSEDNSLLFDLAWFDFCGFFNTNKAKECIEKIPLADKHIIALTLTRNHRILPIKEVMNTMNVTHRYDYTSNAAMTTFIGTKGKTSEMPKTIKLSNKNKKMSKTKTSVIKSLSINEKFWEVYPNINRALIPEIGQDGTEFNAREDIKLLTLLRNSGTIDPQSSWFSISPSQIEKVCVLINKWRKTIFGKKPTSVERMKNRLNHLVNTSDDLSMAMVEGSKELMQKTIDDTIGRTSKTNNLINLSDLEDRGLIQSSVVKKTARTERQPQTTSVLDVKSLQPKEIIVKNGKYNMKTGDLEGEFSFVY